MLKLNKCRTLFQFNEAILASMQTQNQSSGTPAQEKAEQSVPTNQDKAIDGGSIDQKQENQSEKEISSEETKQLEKEHKEEKKENENKEKSQNSQETQGQTQQTENQTQYLFFEPDEFIITTFMYENGWWYGYKDLGETTPSQQNMGYFPSNYVQVIEEYEQQSIIN